MEHHQAPEPTDPIVRIAIVDDHTCVVQSIALMMEAIPGISVVLTAGSGEQFFERLPAALPVDIVFVDLSMPGMNGFETIIRLRAEYPEILPLAFSGAEDDDNIMRAVQAGACGYLAKSVPMNELVKAVEQLSATRKYRNDLMYECLLRNPDGLGPKERAQAQARASISERELDVIQVLFTVKELTTHDAADRLAISPRTVEAHVLNLCKKLGLKGRVGAMLWAVRHKFIDPHAEEPPPDRE